LVKGAEISNGDTIRTGDGGRAQVRFSDGALISLQPTTEFRVDNYEFSNQPTGQEKGFFSLIKGGMRTITGLIGRSNRDNYKVTTSVATIGIRGTEYTAGLNSGGDELIVHAGEGLVEVCNSTGCVLLAAGESGSVQGKNEKPKRTDSRPKLPPAQPDLNVMPVYSTGDIIGGLLVPTSPMPTTGSATYTLKLPGNATPLTETGGVWTPGKLISASVTANFATLAVSTSLSGKINSQSFNVSGSGSVSGNGMSASVSGFSGICGACGCSGSVTGKFYGTGAANVGINYSITDSGTSKTFGGGALLGK
jgi:hypothetical protein